MADGFLWEPGRPFAQPVQIRLSRLAESFQGFRIAQLSDIHFGPYLGERTKGWIAFIVLGLFRRAVSRAVGDSPWSLLLLSIPCAMALDAYRIARRQLAELREVTPVASGIGLSIRGTRLRGYYWSGRLLLLVHPGPGERDRIPVYNSVKVLAIVYYREMGLDDSF